MWYLAAFMTAGPIMKKYLVNRWVHLCLAILLLSCSSQKDEKPYVLLISFDGFRHDYVEKYQLAHFTNFISQGTAAEYMLPSFPSKTFPNHYTVVTGLYPGNHGLVDNPFYDSLRDVVFTMGQRELVEDGYFYGGTPLWQLAQQQGLKSASFFWVGSEVSIQGSYPDYYKVYDGKVPNEARIDTVMHWLNLPQEQRPAFVSLYFSLVDSEGHNSGPNSDKMKETVKEADRLLGLIVEKTDALNLPVTIIITSDHGMYELKNTPKTFIFLGELFQSDSTLQYADSGPIAHVYEDDAARREKLFQELTANQANFITYRKGETPAHWHYHSHNRIGDLVLVAEPGHYFRDGFPDSGRTPREEPWGVHGYDPYTTPEMRAIFYAKGPKIKEGLVIQPFENVHVYPFIAQLLGLTIQHNIDGRSEVLREVIKD